MSLAVAGLAEIMEITRPAFEVTLDVFQYARPITKRRKYEDVIARPPA